MNDVSRFSENELEGDGGVSLGIPLSLNTLSQSKYPWRELCKGGA
jgi:hypothetical protein